jgi:hypothetical protein
MHMPWTTAYLCWGGHLAGFVWLYLYRTYKGKATVQGQDADEHSHNNVGCLYNIHAAYVSW